MTLASVITPSYNSPDIFATIDSVMNQTYPNIEFIIVDDGSKQFDKAKIEEHIRKNNKGNVKAQVVVNDRNVGTVKTMNRATLLSSGDYIINLAGDDCFFDNRVVADIVAEFKRTGALVLTGKRCLFDPDLKKALGVRPRTGQCSFIKNASPAELFDAMTASNFIFGCCTARSRECIRKFGLYNENYRLIEDYSMNMLLLRQGVRFHFYDRIFVKYRSGGVSFASKISADYIKESDAIFQNEIKPYAKDQNKAEESYKAWKENALAVSAFAAKSEELANKPISNLLLYCRFFMSRPKTLLSTVYSKFEAFRSNKKYGN